MARQVPRLKNGVDLQLQTAFSDGNWLVAARLADKRAKMMNDPYYEAVKVCAESQLDEPTAKFAAVSTVWQHARNNTVVKDVDAIDLLEWATQQLIREDDFARTIGPLRVRAAKASPRDRSAVTRCLESCLLHWDLNSAQQIAAIADRSFPAESDFLFWNIVITHLLSLSSQASPEKRKLYGTLAQRQIERAAQATEQAEASSDGQSKAAAARRIRTEEETILLYDVVDAHGTGEDFDKIMSSPVFSPVAQFRLGRKELLQRAVARYSKDGNWAAVFKLCKQCLSETDQQGQPTLLACDFSIWKHLISAAAHLKHSDHTVAEQVRNSLTSLLSSKHMRPMYRRNILLARVSAAFDLGPDGEVDVTNNQPSSLRLRELMYYIKDQATSSACFDDIKGFLERLDTEGLRYLAFEHLPRLPSEDSDNVRAARKDLLSLKAQYFTLTRRLQSSTTLSSAKGGQSSIRCAICKSNVVATLCLGCLSRLSQAAVDLFGTLQGSDETPAISNELLPEVSILIASCSIARAFESQLDGGTVSSAASRHLLRAVLLLEDQLSKTPLHGQISLLLVQLHLFLGSARRASEIWEAVGVKRTIVDSLAPIFYDRLSTISPSLLSPDDRWGEYLRELLRTHYDASLKLKMPRRLIHAFEAGSYGSIIGMPEHMEKLRASCTRVMSLAESKRAERFLGLSATDLINDPRYYEIDDDVRLTEVVDYGSFPSLNSSESQPLHLLLRRGPGPSSRRSHLLLLSETFHDVLSYKPPSVYKVPAHSEPDHVFAIEMMSRLSNSFGKFLFTGPDSDFTPSEVVYFESLSLLCTLIMVCADTDRSVPVDGLHQVADALKAALETQLRRTTSYQETETENPQTQHTVALLGSMHEVSMLRDTAVAIKAATQWISTRNEKERERDRSGKTCLPKELSALVKGLQVAADAAAKEGQGLVARLKTQVLSRDFEPNLTNWIFGKAEEEDEEEEEAGIVKVIARETVPEVVESWIVNVKGWGDVRW